jgi:hypothetical protein
VASVKDSASHTTQAFGLLELPVPGLKLRLFSFSPFALGDVFHGQEDNLRSDIFSENLPGVEQNSLSSDIEKIMLDFISIEHGIMRENLLKEYPQLGNIPLPVANVIDEIPDYFLGPYFEGIVETVVGCENLQIGIQHQKWLVHVFYNVLCIFSGTLDLRLRYLAFCDVAYNDTADEGTVDILPSGRSQMRPELGSVIFNHPQIACLRFTGLKKLVAVQVVDVLVIWKDITGQRLLEQCAPILAQQGGGGEVGLKDHPELF